LNLIRVIPAKGQDTVHTPTFLAKLIGPVAPGATLGLLQYRLQAGAIR
jgi:hypothetical protein